MTIQRSFHIDLEKPIRMTTLPDILAAGDKNAHLITLHVSRGNQPLNMAEGSLHAYVVRADGSTLILPGRGAMGTAAFTLTEPAYRVPGRLTQLVRYSQGDAITTLWWGCCTIAPGATGQLVDPEQVIPSLPELLAQITLLENTLHAAQQITAEGDELIQQVRQKLNSGAFVGRGLTILGHYPDVQALSTIQNPNPGDAYAIGTAAPYQIHIYDGVSRTFRSHGVLQGAKGDPGLTTSVNGVEQIGGNVQLMAGHLPTKDGRNVEQALEELYPKELWQGVWSGGAVRTASSPMHFRYFLVYQGSGVAIAHNQGVTCAAIRTLWQSPDSTWHVVEQLYLFQSSLHHLTMTASLKTLDGNHMGAADPITRIVGIR